MGKGRRCPSQERGRLKLRDGNPTYLMNMLGSDRAVTRCDSGGGKIRFLWEGRGDRGKRAEGSFQGQKQNCQKTKQKGGGQHLMEGGMEALWRGRCAVEVL